MKFKTTLIILLNLIFITNINAQIYVSEVGFVFKDITGKEHVSPKDFKCNRETMTCYKQMMLNNELETIEKITFTLKGTDEVLIPMEWGVIDCE